MSCRSEHVAQLACRYCPDPIPIAGDRVRAVMSARLVDELTGEPVNADIELSTAHNGLYPRIASGGLIGLVGKPAQLFPDLGHNSVRVSMHATARRYVSMDLAGTLGPIAGYPNRFTPLALGDVDMHRASTTLRGRTVQRASLTPKLVARATVTIVGYWPNFPPANIDPTTAMVAPNLLRLSPPLYAARAPDITQVQQRDLALVLGQEKTLLLPASGGTTRLRVSDRIGLAVGALLAVEGNNPARLEHIPIAKVDTAHAADQPAWVGLVHPLAYTHPDGATCQPADLVAPGVPNSLTRAAIPGDETIFVNGMTGITSGIIVELDDGRGLPEYHQVELYSAVSDEDGYFHLPPIARVAMVAMYAQVDQDLVSPIAPIEPIEERFAPDYRLAENRLTVMFR